MKSFLNIKTLITIICIILAIIHIFFPNLKIDSITLILSVTAILPWLTPLFKSLEFPGGYKVEFNEFKKIEDNAKRAGLIDEKITTNVTDYDFIELTNTNPQLALAGLRIELEKGLRKLAEKHGVKSEKRGIGRLMTDLHNQNILNNEEYSVLADMVGTLNAAVHGEEFNYQILPWIMDTSTKILDSINRKI